MNEARPTVSVVIPCYNYGRYLGKAIDSVLAQTVKPIEIVVADDGSTDNTADVVAQYGDAVKYRKFDHCGVCAVRQTMLNELKGEWFLNLDADDWMEPNFIEKALEIVASHSEDRTFAFVYPDIQCFGSVVGQKEYPDFDVPRLKLKNYIVMNSLIRLDAARSAGFDPLFNIGEEDYDFFLTLAKKGYRGQRLPGGLMHYRVHSKSRTNTIVRQYQHRTIMRRILQKHRGFFTREEAKVAIDRANNSILIALIQGRTPLAGFGRRLGDWLLCARVGWRHAEFGCQTLYCFWPGRYFARREKASDVFYLFRDTPERREMVRQVMDGAASGLAGEQLFGFEELTQSGVAVDCNLRFARPASLRETVQGRIERFYAPRTGVGLGDQCSVLGHLGQMNRARVVVATSDNTGLPAARLKSRGRLRTPLVYVSIGLPQRLMAIEGISKARAARYRKRLSCVDRFVAYGFEEAEWLRRWLGDEQKVRFIPFGVDTRKWKPDGNAVEDTDVLSIGSDPMRDFGLLVEYARQRPTVSICLVTNRACAANLGTLPENVRLLIQLPVAELKTLIAGARLVVLPVKENTYSGATTTLLQCMAMGKPVVVSRVGAISEGYGFTDGANVRWMVPGSAESLSEVVDDLLADGDLRCRLGSAARKHVTDHLGLERYVSAIESCLKELLQKGKEK